MRHIVCALSGGVDSAVTAFLLKQHGYKVTGCYMSNWDVREENAASCSSEADLKHAETVAKHLNIPFEHVNFAQHYWNHVFDEMLQGYGKGLTPNPDVLCNRHIKFDRLWRFARDELAADALATGHYAQNNNNNWNNRDKYCRLFVPIDLYKDQTYFLSRIRQEGLSHSLFPLANLMKPEVQTKAEQIGLGFLNRKKESMGVCFIGKRDRFGTFLSEFLPSAPGPVVDVDCNTVLGEHSGILHYTVGQRVAPTQSMNNAYVMHTDAHTNTVYVCRGKHHAHLYNRVFRVLNVESIADWDPSQENSVFVRCQRLMPMQPCKVRTESNTKQSLIVKLVNPIRAIRSGQIAAFYAQQRDGRVECLGAGDIELNRLDQTFMQM